MGRIVGGSGKLNYLIYLKGHQNDFKEWNDSAHYFRKSGLYKSNCDFAIWWILCYWLDCWFVQGDSNHVNVEDLRMVTPLAKAVLKAAKILGYPVTDLNLDGHTGTYMTFVR